MATVTDVEVLEGLDFEVELPCEAYESCGHAAAWALRCRMCGFTVLFCVMCRVKVEAMIASVLASGRGSSVACAKCEAHAHNLPQVELVFQWLPVRGLGS